MDYEIVRSNRKSVAIQIKDDGRIVVRCPKRMRASEVQKLVESKIQWIEKNLVKSMKQEVNPFTKREIEELRETASKLINERVPYYATMMGVSYNSISIRAQRSRWGSCSNRGNLNFNCLLALVPRDVLDYVVIHELCHLIEMNHSKRFWAEVRRVFPDYAQSKCWLKENGSRLLTSLPPL